MLKGGLNVPYINEDKKGSLLYYVMREQENDRELTRKINDEYLESRLKELDDELNSTSEDGFTVLMACAYRGFENDVWYLLKEGYIKNRDSKTRIGGREMHAFDIAQEMGLFYLNKPKAERSETMYATFFRIAQIHPKYNTLLFAFRTAKNIYEENKDKPGFEPYEVKEPRFQTSIIQEYTLGEKADIQERKKRDRDMSDNVERPPRNKKRKKF
jgi:hypothetical protein